MECCSNLAPEGRQLKRLQLLTAQEVTAGSATQRTFLAASAATLAPDKDRGNAADGFVAADVASCWEEEEGAAGALEGGGTLLLCGGSLEEWRMRERACWRLREAEGQG